VSRLQAELQRLYGAEPGHAGPDGRVRAMVLGLARPANWDALDRVWQGVQGDLELPAPAVAVSGVDGYQLWFSLAEPLPAAEATAFLELLRGRYLADVARERIAIQASDAAAPPAQVADRRWSAFVAQDLAGLFTDEPWLDMPPGDDAQADLLSRLKSMQPDDFQQAQARLTPAALQAAAAAERLDPRRFLLDVMNDRSVELQLRIEAAKALLHDEAARPR
jgi:hypothetical protein